MSSTGRRWLASVALAAATIAGASVAGAEQIGCCEAECHSSDAAGRALHSMQRRVMTQAACTASFPGCQTKWSSEDCDADAGVGHVRSGVPAGDEPDADDDEE